MRRILPILIMIMALLPVSAQAHFISNTYIGDGGAALAAQGGSTDLVALSVGGAVDSGLNGGGGQISFAKNGNEILSSYPFIYSSDGGASFASQSTDLSSASSYSTTVITDGTYWLSGATISGQGKVAYSSNRANWTAVNLTNCTSLYDIAYGGGKYIATGLDSVSGHGRIWYSTDRSVWTKTDGGLASGIGGGPLAYGNGVFIAATGGGAGAAVIEKASASDPTAWTRVSLPAEWNSGGVYIAYSPVNNRFVIMGYDATYMNLQSAYSDDEGDSWTMNADVTSVGGVIASVGSQFGTPLVALSGGGFMAGGGNTTGTVGRAVYSADGTAFEAISGASSFQALSGLVAK